MQRYIKGVIFDMDGTITVPLLDFPRIKAEIGIPDNIPILEALPAMNSTERSRADEILSTHEFAAATDSQLSDGVTETLAELSRLGLPTAILTRNCRASVDIVLRKHSLAFDAIVTRDDSPPKPMPDGVEIAAKMMGVPPANCLMVGDFEFDIQAGRAAGAVTVLFSPDGRSFPTLPDFDIRSMRDLTAIIRSLETP